MRATLSHSNSTREARKNYFTPLLTLFLLWIVFLASRPKLRGRLQRHRTRGGRRWPRGGCETHIRGAAAQAAGSRCASRVSRGKGGRCIRGAFPRAHRPSLTAVGRRWTPSHEKRGRRLKGQPTGGSAEQASNTARGTPGSRRPVATIACAPCYGTCTGSWGVRRPGVPRPLVSLRGWECNQSYGRTRRPLKHTGSVALAV